MIHNKEKIYSDAGTKSYWLDVPPLTGSESKPKEGGVIVIGSGLSGASAAYWLQKKGMEDITVVDYVPEKAATFRNCGHILYGTVESMQALTALHGAKTAREIWQFSINICHNVRETVRELNLDADYKQDGYLVIAIDEVEDSEIRESIKLLNAMDFQSDYLTPAEVKRMGFKNVAGARFEKGSAQAHPVKFRNGVLNSFVQNGGSYHSNILVKRIFDESEHVCVETEHGILKYDAAIICANAYSPLFSEYFAARHLVEPYRGQLITSKPLTKEFSVKIPHSFDHGYEYALMTPDNRLMLGGWRNNTDGEKGLYDITPNPFVENGLKDFAAEHYEISEKIEWDYSWAGIMAASKTGFPFIGPTYSPRIFACAGYTGHGFSWAHGSAKLLASIILGEPIPDVARYFRP